MRNDAGELLLVAGYQCNDNLAEAAELRGGVGGPVTRERFTSLVVHRGWKAMLYSLIYKLQVGSVLSRILDSYLPS